MKKFLTLLFCGCLLSATVSAKTWNLGDGFIIDIDDTVSQMLNDLGINEGNIKNQLNKNGIDLNDTKYQGVKDTVQDAIAKYAKEFRDNPDFQNMQIIPTVKDGFADFSESLVYAIQDSSTLQNTEPSAWIGHIFPGFHFRLGFDASVATLDIDPLLKITSALGYDLDLSDATDSIKDMPVIGSYDHHLVFPTVALNARLGGFILPFDIGLSLMSIDTRGNLESVWPSDAGDKLNINYLTFGLDFRYKLLKLGSNMMNVQLSGLAGFYMTKGSVEAAVDEGTAEFDFKQIGGTVGVQASGHLLFVDVFAGAKLVSNFYSKVSLKARPNWRNIMEIDDAAAMDLAVALMPEEIGFEQEGGWGESLELNPVFYGGIGLSAKIIRLGVGASYNVTSKNLGATASLRLSW